MVSRGRLRLALNKNRPLTVICYWRNNLEHRRFKHSYILKMRGELSGGTLKVTAGQPTHVRMRCAGNVCCSQLDRQNPFFVYWASCFPEHKSSKNPRWCSTKLENMVIPALLLTPCQRWAKAPERTARGLWPAWYSFSHPRWPEILRPRKPLDQRWMAVGPQHQSTVSTHCSLRCNAMRKSVRTLLVSRASRLRCLLLARPKVRLAKRCTTYCCLPVSRTSGLGSNGSRPKSGSSLCRRQRKKVSSERCRMSDVPAVWKDWEILSTFWRLDFSARQRVADPTTAWPVSYSKTWRTTDVVINTGQIWSCIRHDLLERCS